MDLKLAGNGLAQHDFLYCGEFDTCKQMQTIFRVQGGKVVWTYEIPTNDRNNVLSEFDDIHQLSNGM
jgi:dTDP-D-glucose 4,6-dehydratase